MEKPKTVFRDAQRHRKTWGYIFTGVYLLTVAFLFWRCRFGFAYKDETFYLTVPYRICMGDHFLLHEWHLSQLSGILLLPLVKLYLILFHGTEGIVLFFRYVFTVVWAAGGLFLWRKLRRFSEFGAMAATLCFLLYAPWNTMALSYQSLSLLLLMTACVLLITNDNRYSDVIAGILYSGAVLCNPFLVLLYLLSALGLPAERIIRKRCDWKQRWLRLTCGILVVLIPFCVMLLAHGSLRDYLRVFPYILDDPEHPDFGLIFRIRFLIYYTLDINPWWKWAVIAAIGIILFSAVSRRYILGFILICSDTVFLLMTHMTGYRLMNVFMFPACFIGLYCYLFDDDPGNKTLFWGLWVPGLLNTFCHFLASNQYYLAFSHAAGIMAIAGILMGTRYVSKCCRLSSRKRPEKIAVTCALSAVLLCQLFCELESRYKHIYFDSDIQYQTVLAEEGPEKGILMNPDISEYYNISEEDIRVLTKGDDTRKVLLLTENSWLYLSAQREYSTYTTWLQPINEHTVEKLQAYYELFPEKVPDAIYFDRDCQDLMPLFEESYYESDENVSEYARIMRKTVKDRA